MIEYTNIVIYNYIMNIIIYVMNIFNETKNELKITIKFQ